MGGSGASSTLTEGNDLSVAAGEEKKEEPSSDDSLASLVPMLTEISLNLQRQTKALESVEQQTRGECQSVMKVREGREAGTNARCID
jgi:hypothetical protein